MNEKDDKCTVEKNGMKSTGWRIAGWLMAFTQAIIILMLGVILREISNLHDEVGIVREQVSTVRERVSRIEGAQNQYRYPAVEQRKNKPYTYNGGE